MAHVGDDTEEIKRKQSQEGYTKYCEIKDTIPYVENYDQAEERVNEKLKEMDNERNQEKQKEGGILWK